MRERHEQPDDSELKLDLLISLGDVSWHALYLLQDLNEGYQYASGEFVVFFDINFTH